MIKILKFSAFICFFTFFVFQYSFGQKVYVLKEVLTADSLASGNFKNALTSFFKFSLSDLTGSNTKLSFSSNLFAIMLKQNPDLNIDTNYLKYKLARNTNIGLNAELKTNHQFNGLSFNIKHALINRRDLTIAEEFIPLVIAKNQLYHSFFNKLTGKIREIKDEKQKEDYIVKINALFENNASNSFSSLDSEIQKFIIDFANENNFKEIATLLKSKPDETIGKIAFKRYNEIKNSYQNKPLWTVSLEMKSFKDKFQVSNINLSSEFLKGFIKPKKSSNLELVAKANYLISADSTSLSRILNRQIINGELGLNWVMKGWANNQTFLEFKLTAAYNKIFSKLINDEKQELFTMNGTLRFRISNDIWIPVTIKYDPKSGNVLGFLNVVADFTALGLKK